MRGLACASGACSGLSGSSGTVGSSRSALLLRLSATAWLCGDRGLEVAGDQAVGLGLALGHLQGLAEARLRRAEGVFGVARRGALLAVAPLATAGAQRQQPADHGEQGADEERHPHRHERGCPVLLVTVDLEAALVLGVGHREGVEQPVAGRLVALGHAVRGHLALGDALPLAVGGPLAGDRGDLGRIIGRDARRAAQQRLHPRGLLDVVLERVLRAGVEPAVERALALEEAREELLRGLRLRIRRGRRMPLRLRGEQHGARNTQDAEWYE